MPNIRKRVKRDGTVSYQAQVRVKGRPPQSATFKRRSDAKIWTRKIETELREGKYFPDPDIKRKTVGDLIDRFVLESLPERPQYQQSRLERQLRWWERQLGSATLLTDVSPALITECRDRLKRGKSISGRKPTPATIKRYLAILSRAFTIAVKDWFWLQNNPCSQVRRPKEPRGRVRFLSAKEKARLLDACRASGSPSLYCLVLTAITTGARQGELMAMRWRDLDFQRGVAIIEDSKNDERRSVPLVGSLITELKKHSKVRRFDNDFVFANRFGSCLFPRNAWCTAVRRAGLENFRFHDLRHTAASYLAMSGATLAEIAEILGHKTLQMVKRYAHLTDRHSHKVAARMAEKFL